MLMLYTHQPLQALVALVLREKGVTAFEFVPALSSESVCVALRGPWLESANVRQYVPLAALTGLREVTMGALRGLLRDTRTLDATAIQALVTRCVEPEGSVFRLMERLMLALEGDYAGCDALGLCKYLLASNCAVDLQTWQYDARGFRAATVVGSTKDAALFDSVGWDVHPCAELQYLARGKPTNAVVCRGVLPPAARTTAHIKYTTKKTAPLQRAPVRPRPRALYSAEPITSLSQRLNYREFGIDTLG